MPNWWARVVPWLWVGATAVVIFGIGGLSGFLLKQSNTPETQADISAPAAQTEGAFVTQHSNSASADVLAEWRQVRGDHKIIAYAIAYCKSLRDAVGDIDTMPRSVFAALMLDLTPLGEHKFTTTELDRAKLQTKSNPTPDAAPTPPRTGSVQQNPPGSSKSIELSSYLQSALFLSDAIGRARLGAVSEASSNWPQANAWGWVTIIVSTIATLLVTIKASMSPPQTGASKMTFVFVSVGLLAMALSAVGTALTSAKQFYDPTRAFRTSKAALTELQRLHKQVALEFVGSLDPESCKPVPSLTADEREKRLRIYAVTLTNLQAAVVMASANLQDSDIAQLKAITNNGSSGSDDRRPGVQNTMVTSSPEKNP